MDVHLRILRLKLEAIRRFEESDYCDRVFADTLARLIDVDHETQLLRDERERVVSAVLHLCMQKVGVTDDELADILELNGPTLLRLMQSVESQLN